MFCSEKDAALGSWRHACALTYDKEMRSTFTCVLDSLPVLGKVQTKALAGLYWSKFREISAKDRRKRKSRAATASASGKGE